MQVRRGSRRALTIATRSRGLAGRLGLVVALVVLFAGGVETAAAEFRIDEAESLLAVLTHRAGFAARLAHNHLIAASRYSLEVRFDPAHPAQSSASFAMNVADLVVDDPELHGKWYPRLEALGLLDEPFKEISEKDRNKIRGSMLGESQLDAEAHPRIECRVREISERPATSGDTTFPVHATLELTIRGRTISRAVPARYAHDGKSLKIETAGVFRFTEFGIKPYSAMLGAVKNRDEFHVFASLTLESASARTPGPPADDPEAAK